MNPHDAAYLCVGLLVVQAFLISVLIAMVLWLICLVRETCNEANRMRGRFVTRDDVQRTIGALRTKGAGGPLTHTDDLGS